MHFGDVEWMDGRIVGRTVVILENVLKAVDSQMMFLQSSAMQDPRCRILPIFNGLPVCPSSWLRNPQPRSVNSVACGLDIAPSSKAVVLCSSPQRSGFTYDVSRFVAKGDRLPSKPFLRTGMAASPNQPISAGGDLETICNGLLPPLRVHAIRERRRGREQTSVVYVKSVGRGEKRRGKEKRDRRNGVVGCWIWDC
jgi:hypothetical protein